MTREEAYIGGQKLLTYTECISPDTKEAIRKWCFETSRNDADIAAMPRPCKFPRWNYKWKLREFFFRPVFTTPPDKDHETICDKKVD